MPRSNGKSKNDFQHLRQILHYEISRYGTLKTWANELGYHDAEKLLDATLKKEKTTHSTLSEIAETEVNRHAETAQGA